MPLPARFLLGALAALLPWLCTGRAEDAGPAFLGLIVTPLPASVRAQVEIEDEAGLLVEFVVPESPAAKAGVKPYDVLHSFKSQVLKSAAQLQGLLREEKAGANVELILIRKDREQKLCATLAAGRDAVEPVRTASSGAPRRLSGPGWCIEMKSTNGNTHSTITRDGRVIFDGPTTTTEDRAKIPPGWIERIDTLAATR